MNGSNREELETARRVLHDAQARVQRKMEMATAMEWVGDRHGATIARELMRIQRATVELARDRLRHLERQRTDPAE